MRARRLAPWRAVVRPNHDEQVGHRAPRARHFHLSHASTCLSFPAAFAAFSKAAPSSMIKVGARQAVQNGIYSQAVLLQPNERMPLGTNAARRPKSGGRRDAIVH